MCVQHENKVCVHSLAYVCAAGGHLAQEMSFIDIIWGAPMKHGKAGASLEAGLQNSRILGEVPSSQGVNS